MDPKAWGVQLINVEDLDELFKSELQALKSVDVIVFLFFCLKLVIL